MDKYHFYGQISFLWTVNLRLVGDPALQFVTVHYRNSLLISVLMQQTD